MLPRHQSAVPAPIALRLRRPELARLERRHQCPRRDVGDLSVRAVEAHWRLDARLVRASCVTTIGRIDAGSLRCRRARDLHGSPGAEAQVPQRARLPCAVMERALAGIGFTRSPRLSR
jgi:hypothetical protein